VNRDNARTFGTKLLTPKVDAVNNTITTRKFDIEHYKQTKELKYLDEGEVTIPTNDEVENVKRMREEVDTLEKFNAIGNTVVVAKKYGVSTSTSHGLKLSLKAKEGKVAEVTEGAVLPSEAEVGDECTEVGKVEPEREYTDCFGQYDVSCELTPCGRISECSYVNGNPIKGTNDDLEGLVEPAWTPPIVRNGKDYKSGECTSDDELWEIVAKDLVHLRKRAIEVAVVKANRNFDERINQILGGR